MDETRRAKALERLLREIELNARETANWTGRSSFSPSTMAAMADVPRHQFVRPSDDGAAYANRPQCIGYGQTISQPYIVALMTDFLDLGGGERILEIGAGSGYQTAVLAAAIRHAGDGAGEPGHIYSLESVKALAQAAEKRLRAMETGNVTVKHGDGFDGWSSESPFDAVIVTAAPESIPTVLIDQLKPGGRMVIPIGPARGRQSLMLVRKDKNGRTTSDNVLPVAFVPMIKSRDETGDI